MLTVRAGSYGGTNGVDARRVLVSTSADGDVRVIAAASGVEV
jgi:hypothetical protein